MLRRRKECDTYLTQVYSWWKPVLAESSLYFILSPDSLGSTDVRQVGIALFLLFNIFLSFHFSFYINIINTRGRVWLRSRCYLTESSECTRCLYLQSLDINPHLLSLKQHQVGFNQGFRWHIYIHNSLELRLIILNGYFFHGLSVSFLSFNIL